VAVRRRSTNPFSQLPLWQANPWEQLFPTHSLPDSYPSADSPVRPVAASPKAQASTAIWAGERQDARAPARFTTLIMLWLSASIWNSSWPPPYNCHLYLGKGWTATGSCQGSTRCQYLGQKWRSLYSP
jgi:hypothetical protein